MSKLKGILLVDLKDANLRRAVISVAVVFVTAFAEAANQFITGGGFNWAAVGGAVVAVVVKQIHSTVSAVNNVPTSASLPSQPSV